VRSRHGGLVRTGRNIQQDAAPNGGTNAPGRAAKIDRVRDSATQVGGERAASAVTRAQPPLAQQYQARVAAVASGEASAGVAAALLPRANRDPPPKHSSTRADSDGQPACEVFGGSLGQGEASLSMRSRKSMSPSLQDGR